MIIPGQSSTIPDIKDIVIPEPLPNPWLPWIIAGVALLILAALIVGIFILVKLITNKPKVGPAWETESLSKIDKVGDQMSSLSSNQFSLQLSEVLKDYLQGRFKDPVRYETAEEFLHRFSTIPNRKVPAGLLDKVADFLRYADEIKFGRHPDADSMKQTLLDQARDAISSAPVLMREHVNARQNG